jgi:hypothetical protein
MIRLEPALHQLNSLLHAQKLEAGKPKVAAAKGGAMPKIKSHVGSDDETKKFSNVITPTLKGIETKGAGGDSYDSAVDQVSDLLHPYFSLSNQSFASLILICALILFLLLLKY